MKNDWRYMKQDRYLHDMEFIFKQYDIPYPAHDHCEFCGIKFGAGGEIQKGYTDKTEYRWICPQCFEDFKELLLGEWHCSLLQSSKNDEVKFEQSEHKGESIRDS